jgi:hypothetical protein
MPSCIDLFEAHVRAVDGPVVERNDQLAAGPDQAFGECPRIPISPALRQGNQRFAAEKAMADNGTDAVRDPVTLGADEWLARLAELPLAFQPGEGWRYHQSFAETKREDQSFDSRLVAVVVRTSIPPSDRRGRRPRLVPDRRARRPQ